MTSVTWDRVLIIVWKLLLLIIYCLGTLGAVTVMMTKYTPLQFEFWTWCAIGLMLLGAGVTTRFEELYDVEGE